MRHAVGRAPTPPEIENAVEEERWRAFQEALGIHSRLRTPSSLVIVRCAYGAWRSAFLGESPTLHVIDGGRS